jgi:copper chaperone CopZ
MRSFRGVRTVTRVFALAACGIVADEAIAVQTDAAVAELRIEGTDCAGCVIGVRAALTRLEGVHAARVEDPEGTARVSYAPESIAPAAFVAAIERLGYTATIVAVTEPPVVIDDRSGPSGHPASSNSGGER